MFHRLVSDVPPGTLCPPPVHTCSSWPPSSSRVWAEAQEQQIKKNQTSFFADRLTRPVRSSIVRWPRYSKREGETNRETLTCGLRGRAHTCAASRVEDQRGRSGWQLVWGFVNFYRPNPPSTDMIWPVMKWGAVAKNMTAAAISSAVPLRRIGVFGAMLRINAAADFSPRSIIPGATQFTAISGASALAMTRVNMCSAAFEEQ